MKYEIRILDEYEIPSAILCFENISHKDDQMKIPSDISHIMASLWYPYCILLFVYPYGKLFLYFECASLKS